MDRSAPTQGYDFGTKRQYRRQVWRYFDLVTKHMKTDVHVGLMPSIEGDEIEVALSKGFRESHLHVVDRNPAIVAHLKRRYPRINTYGVTVGSAADRMVRRGIQLACFNLDFCSSMHASLLDEIQYVAASGCLAQKSAVAITMLRGRENKARALLDYFRETGIKGLSNRGPVHVEANNDNARMQCVYVALTNLRASARRVVRLVDRGNYVFVMRQETYRSVAGHQTMMWVMHQVHRQPCTCVMCGGYEKSARA